jgi:hypothetical protein
MSQVAIGARFAFKQNYADRPTHATGKNSHEQRTKTGKPQGKATALTRLSIAAIIMKPLHLQPSNMGCGFKTSARKAARYYLNRAEESSKK